MTPAAAPDRDGLADFVALNDPAHRRRVEREGGYFVVEGPVAVARLLGTPGWRIRTVVLLPRLAERLAPELGALDQEVAVRVVDEATLRAVVGFDLHRGALASVDRRPNPRAVDLVGRAGAAGAPARFVATEGVNDHENLGAIYRNAAAFGATGVLVDPTTADPFYRRSVRVSSGTVLTVPTGRLAALPAGLDDLHTAGATTLALTPTGDVDLADLDPATLGVAPLVVLAGAEGPGLTTDALAAATHRVRIPMAAGVDSLNVATAVAIVLHHLRP